MTKAKDTIEGLERIENKYPFEKKLTLEDAKCIWEAKKIIKTVESAEGVLPEKKAEQYEAGFQFRDSFLKVSNYIKGSNEMHGIATPILAKKILECEEKESELKEAVEFADRKGRKFDKLNTVKNLDKEKLYDELQSIKSKLTERPKIICLCGSSRFVREMACIGWSFERDQGIIVLGLHLLPDNYPNVKPDHMAEHEGKKEHMDELHRRKIDLADEVFIVNIKGYIGKSTQGEIEYAKKLGKKIIYLEPKL